MSSRVEVRSAMRIRIVTAALILAGACLSRPAGADDADAAALQRGKTLYEEALPLLDAKKLDEACAKLTEAVTLVPVAVGARLALGECEEGRGRLATALLAYRKAQALAGAAGQPDREKQAKERAVALEPKVGSIEIQLKEPSLPSLVVELDGRALSAEERSGAVRVDAGMHRVRATAPGRTPFEAEIRTKDGEKVVVAATLPSSAPVGPASATASASAPPPPPPPGLSTLQIAGIAGGAAGIAAVIAGAAMGGVAMSKNDESFANGCAEGGHCTPAGADLRRAAYDAAGVSTALFIGGGALAGAGLVVFLVAPRPASAKAPVTGLTVRAAPAGLSVTGRF